jgi:bifunctional DNase/RNase
MIEMKVSSLTVDPFTNTPILVLKDEAGKKSVPIWIGLVEASAIATELEDIRLDRPMTHDLMKTILGLCSVRVDRIEIHDVKDDTFFATIFLRQAEGQGEKKTDKNLAVDARPSDAIALALRARAPIFVSRKVVDKAGKAQLPPPTVAAAAGKPDHGFLERLSDHAFGKWKM